MAVKLNLSTALQRLAIYNQFYAGKYSDEDLRRMRRNDLREYHPDRGGDADNFHLVNEAWDRVMQHLRDKKLDEANKCKVCGGDGWMDSCGSFNTKKICTNCNGKGRIN